MIILDMFLGMGYVREISSVPRTASAMTAVTLGERTIGSPRSLIAATMQAAISKAPGLYVGFFGRAGMRVGPC